MEFAYTLTFRGEERGIILKFYLCQSHTPHTTHANTHIYTHTEGNKHFGFILKMFTWLDCTWILRFPLMTLRSSFTQHSTQYSIAQSVVVNKSVSNTSLAYRANAIHFNLISAPFLFLSLYGLHALFPSFYLHFSVEIFYCVGKVCACVWERERESTFE